MFDLDAIENDWKENSFRLTDKEIRQIYISEGVTTKDYSKTVGNYWKSERPKPKYDIYQKMIIQLCGTPEEKAELDAERIRMNSLLDLFHKNEPKRPYLSHESQMKVVEGSMHIVFKSVRKWHNQYDKLLMEDLYYLALEGLFAAAKYCLHYSTVNRFSGYAKKYIDMQIIKYLATKEGITYRNAYCIAHDLITGWPRDYAEANRKKYDVWEFSFDYDKEISHKPSAIYNMTKDDRCDIDYTSEIESEKFMNVYNEAIDELDDMDKRIMRLAYDKDGESVLTHAEIADILGIDVNKVKNTKRRVREKLRKDPRFDIYRTKENVKTPTKRVSLEERFNSLDTISYEEIVALLNRTDKKYYIKFKEIESYSINKIYKYVSIRNMSNRGKEVEYLSPSYDDNDIYENLTSEINDSVKDPHYILNDGQAPTYSCFVGNNRLDFPISIAKRFLDELEEENERYNELIAAENIKIKSLL